MTRRGVQTAEVEVSDLDGAVLTRGRLSTSWAGGTKVLGRAGAAEALVAESTPCRSVWVAAPCNAAGTALNTVPAFVGDAAGQNVPLLPANLEGLVIEIDDAAKVYVRAGVAGERVVYRIFA